MQIPAGVPPQFFEPSVPEDFDEFWAEASHEAAHAPMAYRRSGRNDYDWPGFVVETVRFRGIDGTPRHGWLSYPEGAKRLPGFLWLPPYGHESLVPNEYGTREGFVSLSFNLHGHTAFYSEVYKVERGYFAEGAAKPQTWIFRRMIQDAIVALRVLQAQPEADESRLGAMGFSQGGGMAIWLGALSPIVRCAVAELPFLGAMRYALSQNAYRYPLKELVDFMDTIPVGRETVLHTVSYYDTMHFATRCKAPTLVSLGEQDPACRPEQVEAIYRALACDKGLVRYSGGHGWDPTMVRNGRDWLLRMGRGE